MKKSIQENFITSAVKNLLLTAIILTVIFVAGFLRIEILNIEQYSFHMMDALREEIKLQQLSYVQTLTQVENYMIGKQIQSNTPSVKQLQRILNQAKTTSQFVDRIFVLDRQGLFLAADSLGSQSFALDHSAQPYFVKSHNQKNDYWSNAFITLDSGSPCATVSRNMGDYVIVIRFDLLELSQSLHARLLSPRNFIAVVDDTGAYIAHSDYQNVTTRAKEPYFADIKNGQYKGIQSYKDNLMLIFNKQMEQNQWTIVFGYSVIDLFKSMLIYLAISIILVGVLLFIFLRTGLLRYRDLKDGLTAVRSVSDLVAEGIFELPEYTNHKYEEIEYLDRTMHDMAKRIAERENQLEARKEEILFINNGLENQVKQRTRELKDMNDKLANSLNELLQAQEKLVENEKQAALGGLVAGLSHELNTPIGVTVTTASYAAQLLDELKVLLQKDCLQIPEIHECIDNLTEAHEIILRNMDRSSEMISSFKKVAVEQQSMDGRIDQLHDIIDATLISLSVPFKRAHVEVVKKLDYLAPFFFYPGAISQIVVNICQNAMMHAFDSTGESLSIFDNPQATNSSKNPDQLKSKTLSITLCKVDHMARIIISDNGRGMEKETLSKMYDPFFTTARTKGGSGLGLHIVYSLVTNVCHGQMRCETEIGKGTRFEIDIPMSPYQVQEPYESLEEQTESGN